MECKSDTIRLVKKRIADAEDRLHWLTIEREFLVASLNHGRELLRGISEAPETEKEAAKDGGQSVEKS